MHVTNTRKREVLKKMMKKPVRPDSYGKLRSSLVNKGQQGALMRRQMPKALPKQAPKDLLKQMMPQQLPKRMPLPKEIPKKLPKMIDTVPQNGGGGGGLIPPHIRERYRRKSNLA